MSFCASSTVICLYAAIGFCSLRTFSPLCQMATRCRTGCRTNEGRRRLRVFGHRTSEASMRRAPRRA
eukprot:3372634-Prymnesium_polylepis.1